MLDYLKDLLWDALKKFGGWFLDLFLWLWELAYTHVNEFFDWFFNFCGDKLLDLLDRIAPYIPDGLADTITDTYQWLEYINEWVPVSFAIKLTVAYFAIVLLVIGFRYLRSLLFGSGS